MYKSTFHRHFNDSAVEKKKRIYNKNISTYLFKLGDLKSNSFKF